MNGQNLVLELQKRHVPTTKPSIMAQLEEIPEESSEERSLASQQLEIREEAKKKGD